MTSNLLGQFCGNSSQYAGQFRTPSHNHSVFMQMEVSCRQWSHPSGQDGVFVETGLAVVVTEVRVKM